MKRGLPLLVVLLLSLVSLTGCASYVPFTQELRCASGLKRDNLKNLQFYTSNKIVLRREVESGGTQVTGGHKLLVVSGKTIEEVVIEEHTPGVVTQIGDGMLSVSFEPGSSLMFAAAGDAGSPVSPTPSYAEPPEAFPGNKPASLVNESSDRGSPWSGTYWLSSAQGGNVTYQGRVFKAIDDTLKAHLVISAQSLEDVQKNRKVLPGMRLPTK